MTADNAGEYLDAGASHVIVTSYVFREGRLDEDRLRELVRTAHASAEHQCMTIPGKLCDVLPVISYSCSAFVSRAAARLPTSDPVANLKRSRCQQRLQVRRVGRRQLVLDLSCRRRGDAYFVVTDRWQRFSELAVDEASLAALADSCDEFLVRLPLQVPRKSARMGCGNLKFEHLHRSSVWTWHQCQAWREHDLRRRWACVKRPSMTERASLCASKT